MEIAKTYKTKVGLIPKDWGIIKAKDFCVAVIDGTHDTPKPESEGFLLVTSKNLKNGKLDFSDSYFISERDFKLVNKRSKVDQFDVLYGMIGTIGNPVIVNENPVSFAIKNVGCFKFNGNVQYSNWLKIYLESPLFTNYVRRLQAGTTQKFVGLGFLRNIPIVVPLENKNEKVNVSELKAITTIIKNVEKNIEATTQSIKAAEKLKKALMQNLLSGKLKPDGNWRGEDEFYEDEKFGKVPKGWEVKRVKDVFDFFPTASYSRSTLIENGEVGYIHYGDIHTNFDRILDLDNDLLPFIPLELKKKFEILKDGDLVISDASEDWAGVGKSIETKNVRDKRVIAGLHTLHLRQKNTDLIQGIKGYILNMENVANNIKRLATGIKVYGISKPNLGRVLIPIPPKPEQEFIKAKLDACSNEIQQKQTKIKTLERLKKSLMQHLLTGKKRLSKETIAYINQTL